MANDKLIKAIRAYGPTLEAACVDACHQMLNPRQWSDFEYQTGYEELQNLSKQRDLAYDRPSIGVHYALWYHLQRTHYLIRALTPVLRERRASLAIYDAGCGTGATAWATATVAAGLSDAGYQVPRLSVYGKDTSPFMLEAADSLWTQLTRVLRVDVKVEHSLGSWTEPPNDIRGHEDTLVVCSFLLNSSDEGYLNEISKQLERVRSKIRAHQLLLISPSSKASMASSLPSIAQLQDVPLEPSESLWTSEIVDLSLFRADFLAKIGKGPSGPPSWSKAMPKFLLLKGPPNSLLDSNIVSDTTAPTQTRTRTGETSSSRTRVSSLRILDEMQEEAAEPANRMTYVVGAAGSGKSLVLCERIVRLLERARANEPVRALVTTVNIPLINRLADWIEERIQISLKGLAITKIRGTPKNGDRCITVSNAFQTTSTVWLLNYDKLPTRIWNASSKSTELLQSMSKFDRASSANNGAADQRTFDEEFVRREFELVIFGMECFDEVSYVDTQKTPRTGRRRPLGSAARSALWPHMVTLSKDTAKPNLFLRMRLAALHYNRLALTSESTLQLQDSAGSFTHVFVDEAQDMTRADIRLLARTPLKPQGLFVAGDTTQALRTGGISPRPEIEGAKWEVPRLVGSYRLPAAICEALLPIAGSILRKQTEANGAVPEVRRSAVPGPRPIVVDAERIEQMAIALKTMSKFVPPNDSSLLAWSVIYENKSADPLFMKKLKRCGIQINRKPMLRNKGLEFPLVIFPTDATPPFGDAAAEWVYTALTRATGALVIAVTRESTPSVAKVLGRVGPEPGQLMFWDEQAKFAWDEMIRNVGP